MKVTLELHTDPILIGKFAGICYGRDDTSEKRLKHIIDVGHLSCLRFGMAVFKVSSISRVCLAQLTRSKHLDYLVRSSRYCDESECEFILPPSIDAESAKLFLTIAQKAYVNGINAGLKMQDARYLLPQAQATELYVAGNYQAWKDFIKLRTSKSAQEEVRNVALEIERQLQGIAPIIFNPAHQQ